MRIAVDAMGGDHGPRVIVPGVLGALTKLESTDVVVLFGDERKIRAAMPKHRAAERLEIVHAPDEIGMHESPASAIRRKPNSSLVRAIRMVKERQADAVLSAGSTGAVVAGGLLSLGRIGGVRRPAIATMFPTERSSCVVLDVGANSDCKPNHLLQFAAMGSVYAHIQKDLERPRVGLLNIGEEESKGNELAIAAFELLKTSGLNFIGNVEGRDVLAGHADVIVCDGFVGNIMLKFGESMLRFMTGHLRDEVRRSTRLKLGGLLMRPAFQSFRKRIDYQEEGGAPLLGIDGVVVIAHGTSSERAIENAVASCASLARHKLIDQTTQRLEAMGQYMHDHAASPDAN